jgi:hypothetical protein
MKTKISLFVSIMTLLLVFSCGKDEVVEPETPVISNLDFTITENSEDPLSISVLPSATNATSFKIYFDVTGNPDDYETSSGSLVIHTYPEISATYQIKVVASATGAVDVELTKSHTIEVTPPTSIANFESEAPPYLIDGDAEGKIAIERVQGIDTENSTMVAKITNVGEAYEAVTIVNEKYVSVVNKKVISIDFYQETAASPDLLLKLEGNITDGGFDVEVLKTAEAKAGWQTIEFDFNDAKNSYPNNEEPTVTLSQYQKTVLFIGFGQTDYSGVYYVDNIQGAEFGDDQGDSDADGVIDPIDICPTVSGTEANQGCPAGPSVAASNPTKAEADVMSIYSDYYTNNPVIKALQTDWSSNCTNESLLIDTGNFAIKSSISAANGYAGIEFNAPFDITNYNTIHFDVWSADLSDFRFKLEGTGAREGTLTIPENNKWVSLDIPVKDMDIVKEGVLTDIVLAVISGANPGQVYIDNIYLYNDEANNESTSLKLTVSVPDGTTSVRLTGPWWEWNPAGGPVATENTDGTWTVTFDQIPTANMEYLWVVDGTQENLVDNAANGDCTSKVDLGTLITDYANYANRVWILNSGDLQNTYDSCE